jgi:hypothetical protein
MSKWRRAPKWLVSILSLLVAGCASSVYQVPTTEGCTGLMPAAAMTEHGVNVEVAQVAIQEISLGKQHLGTKRQ